MDAHLAEARRSIDPTVLGRRLRAARVAAGMTQAQVAGGDVTAAYVSRIEVGQRRPEAHLLERMAARMGTSVHQLLTGMTTHEARQLELQVEHAAVALALGEPDDALHVARATVRRLQEYGDPALLAEALRVSAEAHRAQGNPEEAIRILEALTEQLVPDINTLRSLIALCRCYGERNQLAQAIAVGELADQMARRLSVDGLTETAQLAAARAQAYLRRGDHESAARICRDELRAAERSTRRDRAVAYWRASIAEALANGATPAAIEMAKVALTLIEINEGGAVHEELIRLSSA